MASNGVVDGAWATLERLLPAGAVRRDPATLAEYGRDWVRLREPSPSAVVFPSSTDEVVAVLSWARRHRVAVVPSGGRTGLSGGALAERGELVLSLQRMNRVLEVNRTDRLLTAQAGASIRAVQDAAADAGLYYPIDFAPVDTMQLGGNIATNAGGVHVYRYGMTRAWVAGLEVVCPSAADGGAEVLDLTRAVLKDNTGYDLKQLFIGSEGTLGVITRATVRLTDPPGETTVALLALDDTGRLVPVAMEGLACAGSGRGRVLAMEFWDAAGMELSLALLKRPAPAGASGRWYVLGEFEGDVAGAWAEAAARRHGARVVLRCDGRTAAGDGGVWAVRLNIGTAVAPFTPYKNDVSVPLSRLEAFLPELQQRLGHRQRMVVWGHLLDGNLHVNCLKPPDVSPRDFAETCKALDDDLYALVAAMGGSISAEHGIGVLKKHALHFARSAAEVAAMRQIKRAFDPDGILNPGKIFDA
ncbi:MAG: FAD-binding oxidoreductase [Tepidisphaerales bacterium]